MIKRRKEIRKKSRNITSIVVSFVTLCFGYYILNYIAVEEKPLLGNTFSIILGCTMIAVSALIIIVKVKKHFFPQNKKRSRHVFLKDQTKTNEL